MFLTLLQSVSGAAAVLSGVSATGATGTLGPTTSVAITGQVGLRYRQLLQGVVVFLV